MQFMMIMTETAEVVAERTDPAKAPAYWGGWTAFIGAMSEAGIILRGDGLQAPHTATTVRLRDGQVMVQDGPFADSKEQLGGYFIIEVPDLDTAIAWAARSPSARCAAVELRPLLPPMPPSA